MDSNPTVREMKTDGSHVRDFAVPERYHPSGSVAGLAAGDRGVYNNLAFESLAISEDGKTLYAATENGLVQDSLPSFVSNGSRSRILAFDISSGQSSAEYIYDVSPVILAPVPADLFATNGLTDFIVVGDRQFITMERSFASGAPTPGTPVTGHTIRLFYADARNATDVSDMDSIAGQNIHAMTKTLLLDLSDLKHDDGTPLALDNIEGITFGPWVNDKETLILVSDNNFNNAQFTQFVALQITVGPEP
ncbi:MAG: esterase-like activity of phytase family protein [Nitrosospira sp.]